MANRLQNLGNCGQKENALHNLFQRMLKHGMDALVVFFLCSPVFAQDPASRQQDFEAIKILQDENLKTRSDADVVAAIKIFAQLYVMDIATGSSFIAQSDWTLLQKITQTALHWQLREAAERGQNDVIRKIQSLALSTDQKAVFEMAVNRLAWLGDSREAIDALSLIAKTEDNRDPQRAALTANVLIQLALKKNFVAVIENCQDILGGRGANQGILDILSERWR